MGLFSFIKTVGEKVFGSEAEAAPVEKKPQLKAGMLLDHIKRLNLPYQKITISLTGDDVVLEGVVEKQEDAEKIVLAVGNVSGVDTVDNRMTVSAKAKESTFHTVVQGDWLSKIARKYYGDEQKYNIIFEANKPMLTHPDKIYPGQVLRIPEL
jgi:nucleoid-associated protein YgaU